MRRFARVLHPVAGLVLAGALGCGGDLTLPDSTAAGLALAVVGGNGQQGTVGQALPNPVVVQVRTDGGQPIPNRQVVFAPTEGQTTTFDPDTAVTDAKGEAVTSWVLGTAPGTYTAEARIVAQGDAPPAVPLQAAAVAGTPDTIRAVSPTGQAGRRNQTLPNPLVVMVVDRFGNPVQGAEVAWSVVAGGGEVSGDRVATAPDGTSSVTWTLGSGFGLQRVVAEVGGATGSPISFSAAVVF
jgi:hypothetical protein